MASDHSMTQTTTGSNWGYQKKKKMEVREAEGYIKSRRPLRSPAFEWKEQDKYNELNNFKIEVRNRFMVNSYNIEQLGRKGRSTESAKGNTRHH